MNVQILRPDQVKPRPPQQVIQAVNDLIQENWNGTSSRVTLTEISSRCKGCLVRGDLISAAYAEEGWFVHYSAPDVFESGDGYLLFKRTK